MKKIIFTLAFLVIIQAITAQITIQPTIAAVGLVQKDQLWNVLVINSGTANFSCILNLTLKDRLTGVEIFAATTSPFSISHGVKQVSVNIVNPVQYNYLSGSQNGNLQGLIPAGSYSACYILTDASSKEGNLAEACVDFDAEPLSPPMLIFPADSSRLENPPAQFSWIPPTPVTMFDRLSYDILVTEIKEGQSAAEAIEQNIPFYSEGNIPNNIMNYTSASTAFEKDKWYAWQVVARDERDYAGKSNVWVFKVGQGGDKIPIQNDIYLLLSGNVKGTYHLTRSALHLKYFSNHANYTGKIIFYDDKGRMVTTDKLKISQGDNYFDFQLTNRFHSNTVYTITITDPENMHYSLTFMIN